MTDLRALHDAFDELERQADAVTAAKPFDLPTRAHASRPGTRLVPIALAAAVVAAVATGAVLLVPNADPGAGTAQPAASATSAPVRPIVYFAAASARARAVASSPSNAAAALITADCACSISSSTVAMRCWSAWNLPIGTPNCLRSRR